MTLILTVTGHQSSIHVSDRRVVALAPGRATTLHSPLENKTIIFVCCDAVGTIGFTGLAYIGRQPTDEWIAHTLAEIDPTIADGFSFSLGRNGLAGRKLGTIVHRIRTALAALPRNSKIGLSILLAGFRVRRRRCFPFTLEIEWRGGKAQVAGSMRAPRVRFPHTVIGQVGDGWPTETVAEKLQARVQEGPETGDEAVRLAMLDIIRDRAKETPTIGHDLMTVLVPHPRIGKEIVWRFEQRSEHEAAVFAEDFMQVFKAIYSPWILTPEAIFAPSVSSGAVTFGSGNYSFRCGNVSEPVDGNGIAFVMSNQQRSSPPGR